MMILHRLFPLLVFLPFLFMAASSAISKELPRPLSHKDADLYAQIFALQDDGEIKKAAKLIKQLDSQLLMGHVLAQKYLLLLLDKVCLHQLVCKPRLYQHQPEA